MLTHCPVPSSWGAWRRVPSFLQRCHGLGMVVATQRAFFWVKEASKGWHLSVLRQSFILSVQYIFIVDTSLPSAASVTAHLDKSSHPSLVSALDSYCSSYRGQEDFLTNKSETLLSSLNPSGDFHCFENHVKLLHMAYEAWVFLSSLSLALTLFQSQWLTGCLRRLSRYRSTALNAPSPSVCSLS